VVLVGESFSEGKSSFRRHSSSSRSELRVGVGGEKVIFRMAVWSVDGKAGGWVSWVTFMVKCKGHCWQVQQRISDRVWCGESALLTELLGFQ